MSLKAGQTFMFFAADCMGTVGSDRGHSAFERIAGQNAKVNNMRSVSFKVQGMPSAAGARTLESVLSALPGVETVSVSSDDLKLRVQFDSNVTNENRIFEAVESTGYKMPEAFP